jgi:hypothetical protein
MRSRQLAKWQQSSRAKNTRADSGRRQDGQERLVRGRLESSWIENARKGSRAGVGVAKSSRLHSGNWKPVLSKLDLELGQVSRA